MRRERVVAAMSGGVDSSVAAALLVEQGYDVVGITMQVWPDVPEEEAVEHGGCCSLSAVADARRVAAVLGIPHYVVNFKDAFERAVIADFCAEYARGRTPNPCLLCNRDIKFGELLRKAREIGASHVATGHYARVTIDPSTGRRLLLKGVDPSKDQSYALYMLDQEQLSAAIFPLGGMTKVEVRRLARRLSLPTAARPESQEICFVTSGDYRDFLRRRAAAGVPAHAGAAAGAAPAGVAAARALEPGPILDIRGNVLGAHRGLAFYTVGQRKGLGVSGGRPLYVVDIDPDRNAVVVGTATEAERREFTVSHTNFIPFERLAWPVRAGCKIRYRAAEAPATVEPIGDERALVRLDSPQRGVTPGQSAVFYDGDVVLGGGVIERPSVQPSAPPSC